MRPPLIMRCTYSRAAGTVDGFGQMTGWTTQESNVPCYWWSGSPSRSANRGDAAVVAIEQERLLVDRATAIQQGDRITQVTDHTGRVVFATAVYRTVEHVLVERNHLECILRTAEPLGGRA